MSGWHLIELPNWHIRKCGTNLFTRMKNRKLENARVMSLLNWLKSVPVKRARDTENSESEDCLEDENEDENVTEFASDSSTRGSSRGSSTASDSTLSSYKQSKRFNRAWLNGS